MKALRLVMMMLMLATCGGLRDSNGPPPPGQTVAKSVFALTSADFEDEETFNVSTITTVGAVTKGDLLYFTASGTLSTNKVGMVGPDGEPGLGGLSYTLINRPVFALFGRINRSVFFIGREMVVIVPESGTLELLVNVCTSIPLPGPFDAGWTAPCPTTGSFTVSVYSKLAQGVTLATTPALGDNTISASTTVQIDVAGGWQATGLQLDKGQKTFVSASGTFSTPSGASTADGIGALGGTSYPLLNRFVERLYGRVGGVIVDLGAQTVFLSPAAGQLELMVNHGNGTRGTVSVALKKGVVPARGLFQVEVSSFSQFATRTVGPFGVPVPTGITVDQGDPIVVSATGTLTGEQLSGAVTPWGEPGLGGYIFALSSRPVQALYGRIGTQAFFLGGEAAVLAPTSGSLELLVNGVPRCATGTCTVDGGSTPCLPSWCDVTGTFDAGVWAP